MPSDGFLSDLPTESESWAGEGLVTPEQAQAIRARYPAAPAPGDSLTTNLLYAVAGVLLGAAGIALVAVGFDRMEALPLALVSMALLGLGIALHAFLPQRILLADALLVASLVPLSFVPFHQDAGGLALLAPLVPAVLIVWRRSRAFVQTLAVIGFSVGAAGAFAELLEAREPLLLWMFAQLALVAALVLLDRQVRRDDNDAAVAVAVAALALSVVAFLNDTFSPIESTTVELVLGGVMLAVMGVGAGLKHRGLMLGGGIVLAIDAIVFAFDIGGVLTGTLVLVAIAALLVMQAEALKRLVAGGTWRRR